MRCIIVIVLIAIVQVFAQPVKLTIAVNDLKGVGIDSTATTIISERLRSELINTGVFRVMERSEMEVILKEQGFQQSGACDESSCLVQVGQLLGVKRIIAGSIGAVGTFWTISLRMLNVETGEILFTANEDFEGDIKGVISQATGRVAAKLVSGASTEIQQAAFAGKKGDLFIESSETGAKVSIDGTVIDGTTPISLTGFTAGEHEIVVTKGALSGTKKIMLKPNTQIKINVTLELEKGSLEVLSEPIGAFVYLGTKSGESKLCGITPLVIDSLYPGEHSLYFQKKGYDVSWKKVTVSPTGSTKICDTLNKTFKYLSFSYGISTLKAEKFLMKENGIFDYEYQGIEWKTNSHLGLEISPIRFYSNPKGMHSFMFGMVIGMSTDQNECASKTIQRLDKLTMTDTLYITNSNSLKINRLLINEKVPIGYRFMLKSFAFEPYSGIDLRLLNLVHIRGPVIDSSDFWVMPNMRVAFPVGAQIYLYLARNTALVLGFEYNSDMTMIKLVGDLSYDDKLKKNISGGFVSENVSSILFSVGATF